ncbi:MAG: 6-phosphogluconolactonase [Planctomycetota bacterium]
MSDVYGIEDELPRVDLPGRVVVRGLADDAVDAAAADLYVHALDCVRAFGDLHLLLTAGETQDRLYKRLMVDPRFRDWPWARTHLWLAHEGPHGPGDERSVYERVLGWFGDHAGIPGEQVHWIAEDETAYERELQSVLQWREKGHDRPDIAVLGLGAGGAVAGLRPEAGLHAIGEIAGDVPLVLGTGLDDGGDRVTVSVRLLNATRFVAVLAFGDAGWAGVDAVRAGDGAAARLAPIGGELRWYLDAPAGGSFQNGGGS